MPLPPAEHGTTNRWRTGCHCDLCGDAHNLDNLVRRRRRVDAVLTPSVRRAIVRAVRRGASVPEAASAVGLAQQTVWGRARSDPDWAAQLDAALMAGRRPDVPHGSPMGYRHYGCRCPECRAAHHPASA